jgi:hypothetical protein
MKLSRAFTAILRTPTYDFADFLEELRRNNLRQSLGKNIPDVPISPSERRRNWAIPSYDFGTMIEHIAVERPDIAERLVTGAAGLSSQGLLSLPFPECAFIFHHKVDDRTPLGGLFVARLEQSKCGESVTVEAYSRLGGTPTFKRLPLVLRIEPRAGEKSTRLHPRFELSVHEEWMSSYRQRSSDDLVVWDTSNTITMALALLALGREGETYSFSEPQAAKFAAINVGRSGIANPLPPVPSTRCLKIDIDSVQRISWKGRPGSHTPKRPHERAGHHRKLKGRDEPVWVNASKINGGGEPRNYVVESR